MASQHAFSFPRVPVSRFFLAILVTLAVLLPGMADAATAPRKYAGIVVDAKSGKVLYESAPDSLRYPASVTKVMTLYILFQELAAGNLTLKTQMRVSKHAAAAVPTKLGLKAGSTITVQDAIKAIVTISANDIARVIAEHISGSEADFARRMTATAKALGMNRTNYRNASGLPDSGQTTTVRDQSQLAIAIYQHFPKYYEFFQTKSFAYGKRVYGNHNRLLGSNGVDGIKTGYIGASGFNLMTAARKSGHHIVVIGFGFDSGNSRDAKVRELVKEYLPKSRTGTYVAAIPTPGRKGAKVQIASAAPKPVSPAPAPAFRTDGTDDIAALVAAADVPEAAPSPVPQQEVLVASVPTPAVRDIALDAVNDMGGQQEAEQNSVVGAFAADSYSLGAEPAPLGQTRPSAPLILPVGVDDNGKPVDLATNVASATSAPAGGWVVQIGAAPTEDGANGLLTDAASSVSGLGNFHAFVERVEKNGQTFFRARFAGFGDRDDAAGMCTALKKAKMSCLAMQS